MGQMFMDVKCLSFFLLLYVIYVLYSIEMNRSFVRKSFVNMLNKQPICISFQSLIHCSKTYLIQIIVRYISQ